MVRANPYASSFNAGELSPRLVARTDFARYPTGCAMLRNMIALPQGGLARRPGTRFGWEAQFSAELTIVRRFRFSTEQAYVLEFGFGYIRFGRNQGRIEVEATDAVVTNSAFTSNVTGWDDRSTGGAGNAIAHDATFGRLTLQTNGIAADDIGWAEQSIATTNLDQEHVLCFQVFGAPGDKIEFQVGSASLGADVLAPQEKEVGIHVVAFTPTVSPFFIQFRNRGSNADKDVQVDNVRFISAAPLDLNATPWRPEDLRSLRSAQTGDLMYIARGGTTPIYRLERFGHATWSLEEVLFEDGPWLDENDTATTLTPSAATGHAITVTASSIIGVNGGQGFDFPDIGRSIRITEGANEPGWGIITSVTSTTVVVVDVKRTFGAALAVATWRLGAWSVRTGYPRALTFFEQRFVAGGTTDQPQTFWMSQSADIENMRPDSWDSVTPEAVVEDDDALDFTIAAEEVQTILWMTAGRQLTLGTASGQWIVDSDGPVLTPTDIAVRVQSEYACADIAPVRVGNVTLFLQRSRRKLREFVFSFDVDSFVGRDMTVLADHIARTGIIDMAHQAEPDGLLWAVRNDGRLLSFTYDPLEEVRGWAPMILGGSFGAGPAVVESVTTLPGNDDAGQVQSSIERDEVWMVVKRTINGVTKRYIEFFEGLFEGPLLEDYETEAEWKTAVIAAQEDAFYVDCGLTFEGTPTDTITGLDHLALQTVKILADGAAHPDAVVSAGGVVSLDVAASVVQIGLGYRHQYRSLKIAAGAVAGTAVGKMKRLHGITFVLLDSAAFLMGRTIAATNTVEFREVADLMDTAVPLFTGEKFQEFNGEFNRDARVYVEGDVPLPFYMLAIAPEMQTNDLK